MTPSVKNQRLEDGRAKANNAARFERQRDGLYVVLVPVENSEAYMNIEYDDDNDVRDEADMDKL